MFSRKIYIFIDIYDDALLIKYCIYYFAYLYNLKYLISNRITEEEISKL